MPLPNKQYDMKNFALSLGILLCSFFAHSQFKLGPIFGYNLNMPSYAVKGDTLNGQHTASGQSISGGLFASYELDDYFEVIGELLISGRYHNSMHKVERSNYEFTYYEEHFAYIGSINLEIPMLAVGKKDFRKGKYGLKKTLSGYAGPVFSMHLNDTYYRSSGYRISVYNQETIDKEEVFESPIDYRLINLGFIAGAQYEFGFGLRIGARFQTNFMNENANPNFDLRHSHFQFNLGYSILK